MHRALKPHTDWPCRAAIRIEVDVERPRGGQLGLRYLVTGATGDLRLAALAPSARADELWRHTCFEAFLTAPPNPGYFEFNFAPSTQWAAYRFARYRERMNTLHDICAPSIEVRPRDGRFELRVSLALDQLADLPSGAAWRLGLSAVIEEASGQKSYWALAHPPGRADFHHADCFALELAAPERS
jgi:hypothetical protein